MAINYPLTLPTHTGIRSIELRGVNAVAYSASPFTFSGQAHAYTGQMWEADITLPPLKGRDEAEPWNAFLMALNGQAGRFLLGDPNGATPRGAASTSPGTPIITGQTGSTIDVTGAASSQAGWLLAGDYIQIGTASSATLHKVLVDADTDGSGNVALEIWPGVRGTRSGSVIVSNTVGNFRLSSNSTGWSANPTQYSITFGAREAI